MTSSAIKKDKSAAAGAGSSKDDRSYSADDAPSGCRRGQLSPRGMHLLLLLLCIYYYYFVDKQWTHKASPEDLNPRS